MPALGNVLVASRDAVTEIGAAGEETFLFGKQLFTGRTMAIRDA